MTELTNILVPIALSPSCAWAAEYSARFANRFNSKLLFLHAGNCPRETVETFLGQTVKDTSHEITICQGDPADAIVQFAGETSPSLIVMPTHAHGKFRRFLLGSVTAKVLHDVECCGQGCTCARHVVRRRIDGSPRYSCCGRDLRQSRRNRSAATDEKPDFRRCPQMPRRAYVGGD